MPRGDYHVPLGRARVARPGADVTVVTWGVGVRWALDEADRQAEAGVEVEVVDLRTLVPWDRETVRASLAKTNRLVVLHEAARTGGFGAEVAAELTEQWFGLLDAPPLRVAGADLPIAFSKQIEDEVYSARSRLREALARVVAY